MKQTEGIQMNQLHYTPQQHHLQWNIRQLHDIVHHLIKNVALKC